jgi:hypothetical protein
LLFVARLTGVTATVKTVFELHNKLEGLAKTIDAGFPVQEDNTRLPWRTFLL